MRYLSLQRSQLILASFVTCSLLLVAFPAVDIGISRWFFDNGFCWSKLWWQPLLRDLTTWMLSLSLLAVSVTWIYNRWTRRSLGRVDGRKVAYLFLVLFLGAGLIVNLVLKDNFGRARPRDIAEFGGSKVFTPAFVISQECRKNCSFSSGEGAAGFFTLALAMAMSRRRRVFAAAIAVGLLVSFARVSAGAHFFSDIVVSFFVMWLLADVLRFYMLTTQCVPDPREASRSPAGVPGYVRGTWTWTGALMRAQTNRLHADDPGRRPEETRS